MIPVYKPFWPQKSQKYAQKALDDCWLAYHDNNEIVEAKLAELTGTKHALLVSNGTVAMHLVAKCLSYKYPEVTKIIVPNLVYVAAWNMFLADPKFQLLVARTNPDTWNFDIDHVCKLVDFEDTAVLAVHNLGNPISVQNLKNQTGVPVVEDACEALFGLYDGKPVPSQGLASALSFFGNKTITCGEGGAVITNDDELADLIYKWRGQGQTEKRYIHDILGYNYRLTNIQAAILRGQIDCIDEILNKKIDIWNNYNTAFCDRDDVLVQKTEKGSVHSRWMYGIRLPNKTTSFEEKQSFFNSRGVDIRPMFYPIGYHKHLVSNINVVMCKDEVGESISETSIMLPSFPDLTQHEQEIVISAVNEYVKE